VIRQVDVPALNGASTGSVGNACATNLCPGGYSWDAVVWWSFVEAGVFLPLLAAVLLFKRRRLNAKLQSHDRLHRSPHS